jgi:hypothetical protein
MNLSSEWLPGLPADRLDILKRTMPNHDLRPRPVDLFDQDLPSVWTVSDTTKATRRDVVGLFNWNTNAQTFEYTMDHLDLDPSIEYVGFDYWANKLVPAMQGKFQVTIPGQSCAVISVRPKSNQPQLISTSRHVMHGIVDVVEERWDPATKTLTGRSKVVAGDPYELRIIAPEGWTVNSTQASGAEIQPAAQSEGLVRATIRSPQSREVAWTVKFN